MKKIFNLMMLTSFVFSLAAKAELVDGEATITQQEAEIRSGSVKSPKEEQLKISLLKKIRVARRGYRNWKQNNPNHVETTKQMHEALTAIQTPGTPEHEAIRMVVENCKLNSNDCQSILKTNVKQIFGAHIPDLVRNKSETVSIIPSAYADNFYGSTVSTCVHEAGYDKVDGPAGFYALLFGADTCGVKYFGAGLGLDELTAHVLICALGTEGINVGPYASVSALAGVGAGVLFGEGGVCTILSLHLGIGAFAGLAITDGFNNRH